MHGGWLRTAEDNNIIWNDLINIGNTCLYNHIIPQVSRTWSNAIWHKDDVGAQNQDFISIATNSDTLVHHKILSVNAVT